MVKNLLKYHVSTKSYLILKFRNVVKFYMHIRSIFSCQVTFVGVSLSCTHCVSVTLSNLNNNGFAVLIVEYFLPDMASVAFWNGLSTPISPSTHYHPQWHSQALIIDWAI